MDTATSHLRRGFHGLIGLKLVISVSLLFAYAESPLGAGLSLDEESYFVWAQRILNGDLLGQGPFFQDPLYPYLLAGVLWLADGSLILARGFNLATGLLSVILLERVVRRLFSPRHALAAVAVWVLLGSVALDELTLSKEPLMVCLLLGAGALALEVNARRPFIAALAGLTGGALVLARGNFLALIPFAAVAALWCWPRRLALVAIAGLLALPSMFAVRNGMQEGRWLPSTAATGMVFYIGHHPGADGTWTRASFVRGNPLEEMPDYVREASKREGAVVSAAKASRLFLAEGVQFMLAHPADELRLLWKKVRLTLSWEEIPGNYSRSCIRDRFIPALWLVPLPAAVLWPFAVAGVVAHRRRRAIQLIAAASLLYAGTLWVTFIVERYRLPLWVAAAVLAPSGAAALWQWLRSAMRPRVLVVSLPVLACLIWPIRASSNERELGHCLALAGATLLQAGRLDEAAPLLFEAAQLDPSDSDAAFNLGLLQETRLRWPEAAAHYRRALEINADNASAWWGLGMASHALGDPAGAQTALDAFFIRAGAALTEQACEMIRTDSALGWLRARCAQ